MATFAVYYQVHSYGFVDWDDTDYVTENPHVNTGLSWTNVKWALTNSHSCNWHPLTWISHMIDVEISGLDGRWHHVVNVLLHLANTILLFLLLSWLTNAVWRSAFVAALFALHPLRVESVAWISERKDVLSTLFWLLTMWAYARYAKKPGVKRYILVMLVFALGLMSKPMLVTLPLVLLLMDYWPLGRLNLERKNTKKTSDTDENEQLHKSPCTLSIAVKLFIEKIPLFALTAISSFITILAQSKTEAPFDGLPMYNRLANASISYLKYIYKMIWPTRLAAFYPHPHHEIQWWLAILAVLALIAITVISIRLARRHQFLPFGWFWYLITLVPVIGIIQVGSQSMADRYTYVPLIGIFIMVAWGLPIILGKRFATVKFLAPPAVLVLIVLSVMSYAQVRYWRDSVSLFQHACDVTGDNSRMQQCLGGSLQKQGRYKEAWEHIQKAVKIDPERAAMLNTAAWFLATVPDENLRDPRRAFAYAWSACEKSQFKNPADLDTLAAAYAAAGKFEDAVETEQKAIDLTTGKWADEYHERLELYKAGKPYIEHLPK